MSNDFPSDWKKEETISEPLLEVTCEGTLCLEKTWRMNDLVSIGAVIIGNPMHEDHSSCEGFLKCFK